LHSAPARRAKARLSLEGLEDRCCPSAPSYSTPIDLGSLGGASSYAFGLNNPTLSHTVQVVGQADTGATDSGGKAIDHAFLWQDGTMTDLGTLGGNDSAARAINNSSQVVGWANTTGGATDAFSWQNGIMTDLGQAPLWASIALVRWPGPRVGIYSLPTSATSSVAMPPSGKMAS
jgi:probable HAF family extracellular repeat protein